MAPAGWLTAFHLLGLRLTERPHWGDGAGVARHRVVGVGEGTFPTIRARCSTALTSRRGQASETAATFKQGIRFVDWAQTPQAGAHHQVLPSLRGAFNTPETSTSCPTGCCRPGHLAPFAEA